MARVCLTTEYTEHTERHSSAVSREDAKIGGRVVPTSRLPLCGRMVSGFIAERREGQASACPRTSRRSSLVRPAWACTSQLKGVDRKSSDSKRSETARPRPQGSELKEADSKDTAAGTRTGSEAWSGR